MPLFTRFSTPVLSRLNKLTTRELTACAALLSCLISFPFTVIGGVIGCIAVGWLLGQARINPSTALPALWGAVVGGALPQILELGIANRQWGLLIAMIAISAYAGIFRWFSTLTYHDELERRSRSRRNS